MPYDSLQNSSMQRSLTSDPDQFSDEAWDLLIAAQDIARRWRHQQLDTEHLIQALFNEPTYKKFIQELPINNSDLLDRLEDFLAEQQIARREELFIGDALEDLLENAERYRIHYGNPLIEIPHLLIAMGKDKRIGIESFSFFGLSTESIESHAYLIINRSNKMNSKKLQSANKERTSNSETISKNNKSKSLKQEVKEEIYLPEEESSYQTKALSFQPENEPKAIEAYGRDLTNAAKAGELDPVIGRDPEIRRLIKVLSRRGKNNPVLIGPSGVGKTAIIELLAQKIVAEDVPDGLIGIKLISLDLGALIAGAKFRGQFEERLRSVLSEISNSDTGIVLFIDELHTVISNDRSSADAGNLLKPVLASGNLKCIGATTPENYRRTIEKDQALNRRFQQVIIKEPNLDLSLQILRGIKEKYELHHGISITDSALQSANRLANRYISDRCLPDKAIDLIDEAAAQLKMEVTSKPQIIEETEIELKRIELALLPLKKSQSQEIRKLEKQRNLIANQLDELTDRWQKERNNYAELRELLKENELLRKAIDEAEQHGDLEEAARLKYDKLLHSQERLLELEESFTKNQNTGIALLRDQVESEDIADVVARWTGIPVQRVLAGERQKLLHLEQDLEAKVIGQSKAVSAVAAAIRRARAGMKDPRRPVGSFLFLGPTGVGKTELAKTIAASLFDEEEALIRLDMSEFMERNAVARLIGAPPGYVGYEEGGQITEAVRRRPYAVLLLDEIEKAHPDVFNLLLQVLDDGRLTDSQSRTVDFRHTIIIMTSNLASTLILENTKLKLNSEDENSIHNQNIEEQIDQALIKQFRPEFLNRIDEIIKFLPLKTNDLQEIVKLYLADLKHLLSEQSLNLEVDDSVIEALALEGYEPEYGARPLKRVLRRKIENPLATQLLEENFQNINTVRIKTSTDNSEALVFSVEN